MNLVGKIMVYGALGGMSLGGMTACKDIMGKECGRRIDESRDYVFKHTSEREYNYIKEQERHDVWNGKQAEQLWGGYATQIKEKLAKKPTIGWNQAVDSLKIDSLVKKAYAEGYQAALKNLKKIKK